MRHGNAQYQARELFPGVMKAAGWSNTLDQTIDVVSVLHCGGPDTIVDAVKGLSNQRFACPENSLRAHGLT